MPALSLILCSRNDQYMGDSRWRLQTTLNYVARQAHGLARQEDVEVLVADWGSDLPLRDALKLSPEAARVVSFIQIPPDVARVAQKDSPFPEVLALNVAARRARGEYIGRIDQDTLVGSRFLRWFFEARDAGGAPDLHIESAVLFANRRGVPYRFALQYPSLGDIGAFIRVFGGHLRVWKRNQFCPGEFWTSYVGILLLHRSLWQLAGGYDERLIYYNWMETDLILRLSGTREIVDLGRLTDYDFYHLEHYDPRLAWDARAHTRKNPDIDIRTPPGAVRPNRDDWGMRDVHLEILRGVADRSGPDSIARREAGIVRPAFVRLVFVTALGTFFDGFTVALKRLLVVWGGRAGRAWKAVRREPLVRWPALLIALWRKRRGTGTGDGE